MGRSGTSTSRRTGIQEKAGALLSSGFTINMMQKMRWTRSTVADSMAEILGSRWPNMGLLHPGVQEDSADPDPDPAPEIEGGDPGLTAGEGGTRGEEDQTAEMTKEEEDREVETTEEETDQTAGRTRKEGIDPTVGTEEERVGIGLTVGMIKAKEGIVTGQEVGIRGIKEIDLTAEIGKKRKEKDQTVGRKMIREEEGPTARMKAGRDQVAEVEKTDVMDQEAEVHPREVRKSDEMILMMGRGNHENVVIPGMNIKTKNLRMIPEANLVRGQILKKEVPGQMDTGMTIGNVRMDQGRVINPESKKQEKHLGSLKDLAEVGLRTKEGDLGNQEILDQVNGKGQDSRRKTIGIDLVPIAKALINPEAAPDLDCSNLWIFFHFISKCIQI